jgi:hypothetical protein
MEIENHVRWLILDAGFTVEELRTAAALRYENRYIRNIDDLTLGEYVNLLSQNQAQSKLKVRIEVKYLTEQLREIIRIRNGIMHFKLERISDRDLETPRGCVRFLQRTRGLKDVR